MAENISQVNNFNLSISPGSFGHHNRKVSNGQQELLDIIRDRIPQGFQDYRLLTLAIDLCIVNGLCTECDELSFCLNPNSSLLSKVHVCSRSSSAASDEQQFADRPDIEQLIFPSKGNLS